MRLLPISTGAVIMNGFAGAKFVAAFVAGLLLGAALVYATLAKGTLSSAVAAEQAQAPAFIGAPPARDQYFPGTETLGAGEMRVIALGTGMPAASKGQAAASFLVQLGNGENFIFDIGTNAFANLATLQVPWKDLEKVFLGHLHFDHMGDLGA
jgi:ribonuclease Z